MKDSTEKAANPPASSGKKRVLLVENEAHTRLLLLNKFKSAGLDVDLAPNGDIALKKIGEVQVDALILDMLLSGTKGVEVIKQVRRKPKCANVPIFVCTSAARMKAWRRRGAAAGATRIFDKSKTPVDTIVAEVLALLKPTPPEPQAAAPAEAPTQPPVSKPLNPDPPRPAAPASAAPAPAQSRQTTRPSFLTNLINSMLKSFRSVLKRKEQQPEAVPPAAPASVPSKPAPAPAPPASSGKETAPPVPIAPVAAAPAAPPPLKPAPTLKLTVPSPQVTPTATLPEDPPPPAPPPLDLSGMGREQLEARLRELTDANQKLQQQFEEASRSRDTLRSLVGNAPLVGGPPDQPWEDQLVQAQASAAKAQTALNEVTAKSRQFEQELTTLRQARDELNQKLAQAEQTAETSKQRSTELEQKLRNSQAELERVQAELDKHIAERAQAEAELRKQLDAANQMAEKTVAAYREQSTQCMNSLEELAALRKARDELNVKAAQEAYAAADSRRRSEELERQLHEKTAELECLQGASAAGDQMGSAASAVQKAEVAFKEEAARCGQFEQQVARLNQARQELNNKLLQQEQASAEARRRSQEMEQKLRESKLEVERLKAQLEEHVAERGVTENQLREQLLAAQASAAQVGAAYQEETTFHTRSAEEITALRLARDQLNATLAAEQQSAAESKRHTADLEQRLNTSTMELARLQAERDQQAAELARFKTERDQQAAELGRLKAERDQQAAELARFKTERDQQASELGRLNTNGNQQAAELARLKSECQSLGDARDSLSREVTRLRASAESPADTRGREAIAALARVTADLEQERGERRRMEQRAASLASQLENLHEELRKQMEAERGYQDKLAGIEHRLQEREASLARTAEELEKEAADRKLAEEQLRANEDISAQLRQHEGVLEEAKKLLTQSQLNQEQLESQLQTSLSSLKDKEAKLQQESSERQRLQAALEEAERKLKEQTQKHALEISKLQSAVQLEMLERRRLESESLKSRHASLDAERAGRASVNGVRKQLQDPLENLLQATRRLLEHKLAADQKKLAESALENAFLMRSGLREPDDGSAEPARTGENAVKSGEPAKPANKSAG